MADEAGRPLAAKLGIKETSRVALVDPPEPADPVRGVLDAFPGIRVDDPAEGSLDVVVWFVTSLDRLLERFGPLAAALAPAGGLWVAWPKKSAAVPTDLDFASVQRVGLDAGLVDNKSCSVSETWTGLRFVIRLADRPGRTASPSGSGRS
jgi:hypothetical protein